MRIAFAGTGPMGAALLMAMIESNHEVVAVVQNGRKTKGAMRSVKPGLAGIFQSSINVSGAAKRLRIPILWIDKMTDDELAPLRDLKPDLLVVGGFGIILKAPLLNLPTIGCLNCHTSLLPKHRGPNPFAAVVLAGETESGVTFHIMEEGIDTGAIVKQISFPVTDHDTAYTVYQKGTSVGAEHVVDVLDKIAEEGLHGQPQDESISTYDPYLSDEQLMIDWSEPAVAIDRKIRACCLSPFARTRHNGDLVHIARAHFDPTPVEAEPGAIMAPRPFVKIATGEGTIAIRVAYTRRRLPMIWPTPWNRPRAGERLG